MNNGQERPPVGPRALKSQAHAFVLRKPSLAEAMEQNRRDMLRKPGQLSSCPQRISSLMLQAFLPGTCMVYRHIELTRCSVTNGEESNYNNNHTHHNHHSRTVDKNISKNFEEHCFLLFLVPEQLKKQYHGVAESNRYHPDHRATGTQFLRCAKPVCI